MKRLVLIGLAGITVIGCSGDKATSAMPIGHVRTMPLSESAALTATGLPALAAETFPKQPNAELIAFDQSVLVASIPNIEKPESNGFIAQAFKDGYFLDIAYLRNPGVTAVVARTNPYRRPLTADDRKYFAKLAERFDATIWEDRRIYPITGPDGKTPMVMRNRTQVWPEDPQQKGVMTTTMSFTNQQQASDAARYISAEYKVIVRKSDSGWEVVAEITGDLRLAGDEWDPFAEVAKGTGGKVVYAGSHTR